MSQDEIIKRLEHRLALSEERIARLEARPVPRTGAWHESQFPAWIEALRPVGVAIQNNPQDEDDWGGIMSGVLFRD